MLVLKVGNGKYSGKDVVRKNDSRICILESVQQAFGVRSHVGRRENAVALRADNATADGEL